MRRALVTQTTDSFIFGTKLLLKSFLHFNDFEGDYIDFIMDHLKNH